MSDVMVTQGNGLFEMTPRHKANLEVKQKFGGIYKGVEGFRKCWEMIPKVSHVTERIETLHTYLTENPDHMFVELDCAGRRLDNGERFSGIVMEKFEFRDGLISAIVLYWFNIPDFKT